MLLLVVAQKTAKMGFVWKLRDVVVKNLWKFIYFVFIVLRALKFDFLMHYNDIFLCATKSPHQPPPTTIF